MKGSITIGYLQDYIRSKDHRPDQKEKYFLKLAERRVSWRE